MTEDWHPTFDGDRLRLTLAIGEYDHVRDLCTGRIRAEGIAITPLHLPTEEIFHRFLRYREWEVSEISLAKYAALRSQGDASLIAIPVFPSRVFRHSSIYVRRDGPVRTPADLAGRRIGVPEWAQTASVYTRGLLADTYGLDLRGIGWTQAGVNQAGRMEKVRLALPDGIRLQPRPDASLDQLLCAGDLDAVLSAHPPASFEAAEASGPEVKGTGVKGPGVGGTGVGSTGITRLFADPAAEERAYYQATGIFPIMHVVVLRAAVLDRFPWVAMNLFEAFDAAKARSQARLAEYTASRVPLPWVQSSVAAAQALFGPDPFPYGVASNRATLDAFLGWAQAQGVTHRRLSPDELFARSTLSRVRV